MNPYIELGITPQATLDELKQAYRRAVFRYHPDSAYGQGDPEKFNAALRAYEALKAKHEQEVSSYKKIPNFHKKGRQPNSVQSVDIDHITLQLPVEHLIYNLENTENVHVCLVAMKALVLKNNAMATNYLLKLLHQIKPDIQCYLIRIMGESKLEQAVPDLFPWVFNKNSEVAFTAIKSLELIAPINRSKIFQALKEKRVSHLRFWSVPFQKVSHYLIENRKPKILGRILLKNQSISLEQLQIALLLQKEHPLLLGTILTKLGYTSFHDIQQALLFQKR